MHKHVTLESGHAGQHIPAAEDGGIAADPVRMRRAAGGHHHHIGRLVDDVLRLCKAVQPDGDAELGTFAL